MDKSATDIGLVQDIRGLDQLRRLSNKQDADSKQQALEAAAKQFESIFNQMWVSSMREANESIVPDSPLNSRYSKMFEGMLDEQRVASASGPGGTSSLANLIVKQLSPKKSVESAGDDGAARELKMPETRLPVMRRFARWEGDGDAALKTGTELAVNNSETESQHSAATGADAGVAAAERFVARMDQIQGRRSAARSQVAQGQFSSPAEFVRQLLPVAKQVAKRIGLSPVALLAQAALETGWGKSMMRNGDGATANNLFGIKAGKSWQGQKSLANSLEYENGQPVMRKSAFRSYGSYAQSMEDYIALIGENARYSKAKAVAHDPDAYFDALQQAGYATDPHYASKLKQVIRSDAFNGVWQESEI